MWASFKKFFIAVIFISFFFFLSVFFILQSTTVCELILTKYLEKKGYTVGKCQIDKASVKAYPGIVLRNLRLDISDAHNHLKSFSKELQIQFSEWDKSTVLFKKNRFNVNGTIFNIISATFDFDKNTGETIVALDRVGIKGYKLKNIRASVKERENIITLNDLTMRFCYGSFRGNMNIDPQKNFLYDLNLSFYEMDLNCASILNTPLLGGIYGGPAEGSLAMKADLNEIVTLNGAFALPRGGKISTEFFKTLVEHLPEAELYIQPIDKLIQSKTVLGLRTGTIKVELKPKQLSVDFYLLPVAALFDVQFRQTADYVYDKHIFGPLLDIQSMTLRRPEKLTLGQFAEFYSHVALLKTAN